MLPAKFSLRPKKTAADPVFEDRSGERRRRLRRLVAAGLLLLLAWISIFGTLVMQQGGAGAPSRVLTAAPRPAILVRTEPPAVPKVRKSLAPPVPFQDVAAAEPAEPTLPTPVPVAAPAGGTWPDLPAAPPRPCAAPRLDPGSASAALASGAAPRVYGIMMSDPVKALLSLKRNCARIDVLVPEWYEIRGADFAFSPIVLDTEMETVQRGILADRRSAPLVMPMVSLAHDAGAGRFAATLRSKEYRDGLIREIAAAAEKAGAVGMCMRFEGMQRRHEASLAPFLMALRATLSQAGHALCVVSAVDDELWASAAVAASVDQLVVTMYAEPWLGSLPGPLAAEPWFEARVAEIAARVGKQRLTVALGSFAVDWTSGQALPERISYAEAMSRIARHGAEVELAGASRNSTAVYVDAAGLRHRIWMLDAVSVHNSLRILEDLGISNIAIGTMGREDDGLWSLLDRDTTAPPEVRLRRVSLLDHVSYAGTGSFYRLVDSATDGARELAVDPESSRIVDQVFATLPQPYRMQRFGAGKANQVALTFDDGPHRVATGEILDVLRDTGAKASFFVVGRQAITEPHLLRRAVNEGHLVGLHTFFHPRMEDVSPTRALSEINAVRNLVEGATGLSTKLYRAPYVRGPGPIEGRVAASFDVVGREGLIVAGGDIVPPDWSGMGADGIVQNVLSELERGGGNVIILHDGRSEGMHTVEAVRKLVPALRAQGYEIVPLSALLGMSSEALMPPAQSIPAAFNSASFRAIGSVFSILIALFWLALIASFLRATIYLVLARRRESRVVRPMRVLPGVTVVIPAYNEEVVILQSIVTTLMSDYPGLKVIVVDDGSTDATAQLVDSHFGTHPDVRLITQRNAGKWQALNRALAEIDTEIAVCVDADTRIARDAIFHLVQPFVDWQVGAVAGTVIVANRTNLLTRMQAVEYTTAQQIGRRAQEHLNGILVVPGALGAWRVDAVREIGAYSNETLTEDADLTLLMRRAGYRIAYAENALSYTEVPADVRSFLKQRLRWSLGNLQSLWKHRGAFGEWGPKKLFSMFDMIVFGYLLPLVSPVLDVLFLMFLFTVGSAFLAGTLGELGRLPVYALAVFVAIPLVDIFVAWRALRYDGRQGMRLLFVVPLMNFVHRPLIYAAVYRAMWSAASGRLAGWNKLRRLGGLVQRKKVRA